MNDKTKSIVWWVVAIIFTISIAVFQRMTGPTYPVTGKINIAETAIKFKLLRSHVTSTNALITFKEIDTAFTGSLIYRHYKSDEQWTEMPMKRNEMKELVGELPAQPMAGKLEYKAYLKYKNDSYALNTTPVVIRFTGDVPPLVMIPHILLMFLAMLFSSRTGIEALIKGKNTFKYTIITLVTLFIGGIILGPVVQKYAFGAYWTGWPFGKDLTDNKTLIAFIFWAIAAFVLYRNKAKRTMVVVAAVALLLIYMIPHSMFGSELNYKSGQVVTGK